MEAISMYKHMKSGKVQTQESLSNKQVPISINASFDEDLSQNRDQNDVNNDKSKINYTWYDIDQKFIKAIELYNKEDLKTGGRQEMSDLRELDLGPSVLFGVKKQPIFIDLIVNMILFRVYVNVMDRKLLTAEKILGNAESLINLIKSK